MPAPGRRTSTRTTAQRGYGNSHKRLRDSLLRRHVDGSPCPICGLPMFKSQTLDANHSDPRALNGSSKADELTHSWCNRGQGTAIAAAKAGRLPNAPLDAATLQDRDRRQSYCAREW